MPQASPPSTCWSGSDASTSGGAREGKGEVKGGEGEARGQMSSSGGGRMVVGLEVQVQPVWNGDSAVVGGGASHSDSTWRDMALRRCLRMRAAARADEGKLVSVSVEEEDEMELEDIGATEVSGGGDGEKKRVDWGDERGGDNKSRLGDK